MNTNKLNETAKEPQAGLGGLRYCTPPAPDRQAAILRALSTAEHFKEQKQMMIFNRIFAGPRWYINAAGAALLLMAVATAVMLFPRQTSLAQESGGYVLSYDLGTAPEGEQQGYSLPGGLESSVEPFHAAIRAFVDKQKEAAKAAGQDYNNKVSIRMTNRNGQLTLVVGLANADAALMQELKAALAAAVPSLPEPQVQDATWFSRGELDMNCEEGLTLLLDGHVFTFGEGFTAEEVEKTLNDWLKDNKPGAKATVTVNKSSGGAGEHNIEVKVNVHEDGDAEAKPGDPAPAPAPAPKS